jgi:hypothetical protein
MEWYLLLMMILAIQVPVLLVIWLLGDLRSK